VQEQYLRAATRTVLLGDTHLDEKAFICVLSDIASAYFSNLNLALFRTMN